VQGQYDVEGATRACFFIKAASLPIPGRSFDYAFNNCQTQSGPEPLNLVLPDECSSTSPVSVELLEDQIQIFRADTNSGVTDDDSTPPESSPFARVRQLLLLVILPPSGVNLMALIILCGKLA
jgi:hypothetical protein